NSVHIRGGIGHVPPREIIKCREGKMVRTLIRTSRLLSALVMPAAMASACAPMIAPQGPSEPLGVVEPVYGAAVAGDVAVVRVSTNGCTRKSDLTPHLSRGAGKAILTVRRTQADTCNQPAQLSLQWTFEELGLEPGAMLQ